MTSTPPRPPTYKLALPRSTSGVEATWDWPPIPEELRSLASELEAGQWSGLKFYAYLLRQVAAAIEAGPLTEPHKEKKPQRVERVMTQEERVAFRKRWDAHYQRSRGEVN